jgi:uncharacterized membrane protein YidH (DUF202 family)
MPDAGSADAGSADAGSADASSAVARTTLAWIRTSLGFMIVSLLLLRLADRDDAVSPAVAALSCLVLAALMAGWHRRAEAGRSQRFAAGTGVASARAVALATGFTVSVAIVSLTLILLD